MSISRIAALYCRISKSDGSNDESNSIANQKSVLEKAAALHGFKHTQFFVDDGYRGTIFDRPALKQLEDAVSTNRICAVLVKDLSRLGRNYLKVGFYLEQFFPAHNVRFIAISGGIDSNTNSTDFLPLYSVMDEWYAKDISRKVRMMYQIRAARGEPVGTPMYGYTRSPKNPKYWEPDPEAAHVVQRIYQLAFQEYGTKRSL